MSRDISEAFARFLYLLLGIGMLPVLVAHLVWRGLRQPEYLHHWSERFLGLASVAGRHAPHAFDDHRAGRVLWIHAVSVGETRAAAPLIGQWLAKGLDHYVVLTHTTPTGRETGRMLFSKWLGSESPRIIQRYLPYDFLWANHLFLSWARPSLGVLMETELWPNLLAQAKIAGIPMVLINARLSPRSAARLLRFSWLSRPAIESLAGIAAQSELDAHGFLRVAKVGRITIVGNMKFDVTVPNEMVELGQSWRKAVGPRRVWLAASTREDEEAALLAAWKHALSAGQMTQSLLVIVPRHPQRFDRVANLMDTAGLEYVRRSVFFATQDPQLPLSTSVVLGDSLGEMFAYLQLADIVLVGGSIPALGGQNPIEACALGRPVFYGPHMFNFHQIVRALTAHGAGAEVADHAEWIEQGQRLLSSSALYEDRSALGLEFAQIHRGATQRTAAFLDSILQAGR